MDTGKIFLGIALIAVSFAMVINPASAAMGDSSCPVGSGNLNTADYGSAAGSLQGAEYSAHSALPACSCISQGKLP